jgi:hypothetical protein
MAGVRTSMYCNHPPKIWTVIESNQLLMWVVKKLNVHGNWFRAWDGQYKVKSHHISAQMLLLCV